MDKPQVTEYMHGFQVRIWYVSGSMDSISGLEFLVAAARYSEACTNPRVLAAEVRSQSCATVAAFTR
jgi:hypothetical protein